MNRKFTNIATEYEECLAYCAWAQYYPQLRDNLIHHVNEGKRSLGFGKRLKLIGMRKGIPDYQLPIPNAKYHGLWIEMKRKDGEGKKKDPAQEMWIDKLTQNGHYAAFAYGWEHAAQITKDYLNNSLT